MSNYAPPSRRVASLILMWVALLSAFSSYANDSRLHQTHIVRVAVPDQTERQRAIALRAAFEQVLIKMAGQTDAFEGSEWRRIFRSGDDYLTAYQFDAEQGQLYYVATFDIVKVQELLRREGVAVWDARRPDSILWLSVYAPNDPESFVLSEGLKPSLTETIDTVAEQRGIALALPLMDIEDSLTVSPYDIAGRFMGPIVQASTRYNLTHIIAARVKRSKDYDVEELQARLESLKQADAQGELDGADTITSSEIADDLIKPNETMVADAASPLFSFDEFSNMLARLQPFQLDYTFVIDGQRLSGALGGETLEQVVAELVHRYADSLSRKYAIHHDRSQAAIEPTTLVVSNLTSMRSFTEVSQFLNTLSLVESATLHSIQGQQGSFEIRLFADRSRLIEALLLDGRLLPKLDAFGNVIDDAEFVWRP
ncbi:DUF2066 domain-containing protein [Alteromonas oceanisediminis]|uniref:DUF2066 domain-containing protein n=1 Tax=Alteromonas oceanisediminis TaxID=2836180 RepID=UPI001BDADF80|nr:DUF2066 domain-containing protein [Alteromonas oceanisediminis]MBT0586375.1 DUF2066 domain-containing protein [Alteromonas oceanisediminis]